MGLTWIDYEEIDKPIEEIAQGTREADDIEFHVETLSNAKELDTHSDGKYFGGSNNLGKSSKKDMVGGIKVNQSHYWRFPQMLLHLRSLLDLFLLSFFYL